MKTGIRFIITIVAISSISCVPTKQFRDLEKTCISERATLRENLKNAETANKEKDFQILNLSKELKSAIDELEFLKTELQGKTLEHEKMLKKYDVLKQENDYLASNSSSKKILEDLQRLQQQLIEREDALIEQENQLKISKEEIDEKNKKIEELNNILIQQSQALNNLKEEVLNALKSYDGQGIDVIEKDGKIYVLMDESLLFTSGSYNVSVEGKKAIQKLGNVLAQNPNIKVLVEGHTDNVPYNGSGQLKDNWDLSVMRATSVLKIILENKNINPERLTATGHGEFAPVTDNSSSTGKAKNRRTEIILAPDLQKLFDMLKKY